MMNDALICIQARMSSTRLPGKALVPLGGKPCLQHQLEAVLQYARAERVRVLTSKNSEDNEIVQLALSLGIESFRGDLLDVASRFLDVGRLLEPPALVRLSGDSPLLDYHVIAAAICEFERLTPDLVTTAFGGRYPSGMNVEVINRATFEREFAHFDKEHYREHVTPYFYEHAERFQIVPLQCPVQDPSSYKFTLDDRDDLRVLQAIFSLMNRPPYEYSLLEKCELYRRALTAVQAP